MPREKKKANIREKRSTSICPTRLDQELLVDVGQILREECKKEEGISIELDADSREIETEDSTEFAQIDIPSDTYSIRMVIYSDDEYYDPVEIEIDLRKPTNSRIRVMGENATWVQGVSDRLTTAFEKKKLGYRHLAKYPLLRFTSSILTSILLSYVVGLALWIVTAEPTYVIMFVAVFFYAMAMLIKKFFDWVFPYFEIASSDFLPKRVRKWALTRLFGSGIVPAIVFKLLGLP